MDTPIVNNLNLTIKSKSKHTSVDFDSFWKAYPKKIGKAAALNAWTKSNGNRPSLQIILDAIAKQKESIQWTKDNGQYIPNPTTWINQGRWDDEPETSLKRPKKCGHGENWEDRWICKKYPRPD